MVQQLLKLVKYYKIPAILWIQHYMYSLNIINLLCLVLVFSVYDRHILHIKEFVQ